ncbi:hypothetical protein ABZU76_34060 [Amycolatopsis sp. NPDC005232]|uniref:hypothetical protein n=1 Tax=Amycolatopsis sp. NPDC005232 TaxID=3157027 RepID=UPI0033B5BCF4
MKLETAELLQVLGLVAQYAPEAVRALATGAMTSERQRAYGDLFIEVGAQLKAHADRVAGTNNDRPVQQSQAEWSLDHGEGHGAAAT